MSRTRKQAIPDWYDELGSWHARKWNHNNLSVPPIIQSDHSGKCGPLPTPALRGRQVTVDENHGPMKGFPLTGGIFHGDIGGEFLSQKWSVRVMEPFQQRIYGEKIINGNRIIVQYDGPFAAEDPNGKSLPVYPLNSLAGTGTTAIARCKPTNNVADLAASLFEIYRDGLPRLFGATLWKDHTLRAKSAGSEYLNSEFGWKPLVSDIHDTMYGITHAHKVLESYERNSGKIVRRRYEFPIERTESTTLYRQNTEGFNFGTDDLSAAVDDSLPVPNVFLTTKFYRKTWFSGAFTYHLPIGYKSRNRMVEIAAKAGPLLGIELTPEVVWNASPWTWAIDWFSNAGDVISNVSDMATDGLVLKWGYLMEHSISSYIYTLDKRSRYSPYPIFASPVVASLETKRRVKATPFGFETSWNGMSPRQLAIAAALGITRVF